MKLYRRFLNIFGVLPRVNHCAPRVITQFNTQCFEIVLRDTTLVQSPVGEEFSVSLWNQCQPNIVRNFIAVIPVYKANIC